MCSLACISIIVSQFGLYIYSHESDTLRHSHVVCTLGDAAALCNSVESCVLQSVGVL